jgi:hypothetical protein
VLADLIALPVGLLQLLQQSLVFCLKPAVCILGGCKSSLLALIPVFSRSEDANLLSSSSMSMSTGPRQQALTASECACMIDLQLNKITVVSVVALTLTR